MRRSVSTKQPRHWYLAAASPGDDEAVNAVLQARDAQTLLKNACTLAF